MVLATEERYTQLHNPKVEALQRTKSNYYGPHSIAEKTVGDKFW